MSDPAAYPHRKAVIATHNPAAAWTVVFADEAGEPDAETICRLQDAIEVNSHVLLAARTAEALESIAEVLARMLADVPPATIH